MRFGDTRSVGRKTGEPRFGESRLRFGETRRHRFKERIRLHFCADFSQTNRINKQIFCADFALNLSFVNLLLYLECYDRFASSESLVVWYFSHERESCKIDKYVFATCKLTSPSFSIPLRIKITATGKQIADSHRTSEHSNNISMRLK